MIDFNGTNYLMMSLWLDDNAKIIPKLKIIQQNYIENNWYAITRHMMLNPEDDAIHFYSLHCITRMEIPVDSASQLLQIDCSKCFQYLLDRFVGLGPSYLYVCHSIQED